MPPPSAAARDHALDSLRGVAMFLGILLHAAISFMANPPAFWPVRDDAPTPLADVLLLATHDFRMQLFFLLAGYFGCLLHRRYGTGGMLRHRVERVAIPFALALLFVTPTVQAAFLYAEIENVRAVEVRGEPSPLRDYAARLVAETPEASTGRLILDRFTSGEFLTLLHPIHLWFLYYLLFLYAAVGLLAPLLGRLDGTAFLARFDAAFRRVVEGRARLLVPALLTFPLMLPMNWVVDTPAAWSPRWHVLAYYGWFFAFGWLLFRHRDLTVSFGRGWRMNLIAANALVLPALLVLVIRGTTAERVGEDVTATKLAASLASVAYTWLMIAGLWGAFLHHFSRERAWVRYLADASYWCYLASLTPIVACQFWVKDWPAPAAVKFAVVTGLSLLVLLASYEWCVRYTFVGAILNGRKHRRRAAAVVGVAAEVS